jgi:hypothetical protein
MSAGLELADVLRHCGEAYRRAHDGHLGRVERRCTSIGFVSSRPGKSQCCGRASRQ